jgi:phage tail P2-like protein
MAATMNSLLPPNASPAERSLEAAMARIADVPVPIRDLWNPQTCPLALLPWLAWALSLDTWRSGWPEHIKRARIASAFEIQKHKGTAKSVSDVVESFGGAVEITEWWQKEPKGEPHTFELSMTLSGADGAEATAQYVDDVIAEVTRTKPVRSHFTFTQGVNLYAATGLAAVARPCLFARLDLVAPAEEP